MAESWADFLLSYSNGLATLVLILFSPSWWHLRETVHLSLFVQLQNKLHVTSEHLPALTYPLDTDLEFPSRSFTSKLEPRTGAWREWGVVNAAHSYIFP